MKRRKQSVHTKILFFILAVFSATFCLPMTWKQSEQIISEPEEVYLGIQPGLIFERFLNAAGSELRQALYQFGYLAQEILKIDPYHDELALRSWRVVLVLRAGICIC